MLALLVISPVGARDEKDKSDYSKEAYILEKLIVTHRYEKDGTGVREYHVRVKIQNEGAIETFGQLVFNFSGDNEKLEIENVTVTKPNGEKITATASNIQEVGAPVFGEAKIYTDLKQKHVTVPGLRPGDILEYRIAWKVTSPIIQNNFWIEHQFLDKDRIVLDEQLEINIPRDVYVKLKTEKDFDPIIKEEGDRKIYQWKRANLTIPEKKKDGEEEEKKDEKSDDDDDVGPKPPHVQLTTFKTWEEVGKWYSDLVRDRLQPDEKVRAKALELTKNLKTDQEKIETLYKFAAQNFRYVSLSLGQGRYQPHAASAVLTNQYGDCKDKHTLLTALLKSIGINADTVLINAERKLDPELPSPGQFNHVITAINYGSAKWWVDTTAEVAPFRLLNPGLRKKQALLVPETAPARLETTPTGLPFNAIENIEFKGAIDNLGEIKMSANLSLRGDPEMPYRLMFRRVPKDDQEKLGSVLTYNMGYGFDFSDIKFSDPGEVEKPYNLQFTMKKAAFLDRSEKKQQLEPPLSTFNVPSIVEKKKRTKPVEIGEPVETNYKSRIDIPAGYKVRIPIPISLTRDYAEYKSTYKLEGNTIVTERYFRLHKREIPPELQQDYIAFKESTDKDQKQTFTLETDNVAPPPIPETAKVNDLIKMAGVAIANKNYQFAEEVLNKALAKESDNKEALHSLASTQNLQRKYDAAIETGNKIITKHKYEVPTYHIIGRSYWSLRKYDDAEKVFLKIIEISQIGRAHV